MAVTGTKVFALTDLDLVSTWTKSGSSVTNITTGTGTRTVAVTIPDDGTVTGAQLEVTASTSVGGAQLLTVNDHNITYASSSTIDFSGSVAAGNNTFTFKYKTYGSASATNPRSVIHLTNMLLTVTYETPDPTPPEDPDVPAGTQESHGLIVLFEGIERDFGASLGLALLTPSSCTVHEEAGGDYSLQLTHPLTPDGRWRMIQPWRLVRVPVPMSDTPAMDGSGGITLGYDIWVVTAASTGLYDRNYYIRYAAWEAGKSYAVGALVRYQNRNYRCKVPNDYSTWVPGCWTSLGSGDPVSKRAIANGTRLYVSATTTDWLTVKLPTGETGYCKKADCAFIREATQEDIDALKTSAHSVRSQVFRLTEVTVTDREVTARGLHVSYDYAMQVVSGVTLADSDLPNAVLDLRASILGADDTPAIYCEDTGVSINTSWSAGSTPVEALLNPDTGLVGRARARLVRDNWDFFLIQNEDGDGQVGTDRGFRIEYGVNLTGISWQRDFSSLVTRVIPVGENQDGSPLYLDGQIWVESPIADVYPMAAWQYKTIGVQVGQDDPDGNPYTEETARAEMERQAEACFSEQHLDEPRVELKVQFVQLGTTEAFKQYKALERLSLYDRVTVVHPDIGLETRVQVKAYDWDAVRQCFTSITLGDVFHKDNATLAGWELADGTITAEKLAPGVLS